VTCAPFPSPDFFVERTHEPESNAAEKQLPDRVCNQNSKRIVAICYFWFTVTITVAAVSCISPPSSRPRAHHKTILSLSYSLLCSLVTKYFWRGSLRSLACLVRVQLPTLLPRCDMLCISGCRGDVMFAHSSQSKRFAKGVYSN